VRACVALFLRVGGWRCPSPNPPPEPPFPPHPNPPTQYTSPPHPPTHHQARLAKLKDAGTDALRERAALQEALIRRCGCGWGVEGLGWGWAGWCCALAPQQVLPSCPPAPTHTHTTTCRSLPPTDPQQRGAAVGGGACADRLPDGGERGQAGALCCAGLWCVLIDQSARSDYTSSVRGLPPSPLHSTQPKHPPTHPTTQEAETQRYTLEQRILELESMRMEHYVRAEDHAGLAGRWRLDGVRVSGGSSGVGGGGVGVGWKRGG